MTTRDAMTDLNAALREVNRIVREGGTEAERVAARARVVALLPEAREDGA